MSKLIKIHNSFDDSDIGFVCRSMACASMPHSRIDEKIYVRSMNNFKLSISAHPDSFIPYGVYPRLILYWLITEVVQKKSKRLILGLSLSGFMKKLGVLPTGVSAARMREQLEAVFSSNISFSYKSDSESYILNMGIVQKSHMFWDPKDPDIITDFRSEIILGEAFFEEVMSKPIPVSIQAINALKSSSLALDIYFWLTYRSSYLKDSVVIPFDKLQLQFGGDYQDTPKGHYQFKRKFLIQLKNVLNVYPEARVEWKPTGLLIRPGDPHIKKAVA